MLKKGIFGGTFDPIHIGHINIAYEAIYKLKLDKIIFMPSGNPPHKSNKNITDSKIRLDMVKLAIENEEKFEVSTYEVDKNDISYTYQTLEHFRTEEPETEWFFISGVDCLMDLHKWKNTKEILENCNLVVFSRGGFPKDEIYAQKKVIEEQYNEEIIFLDIPLIEVSSTLIRDKVSKNEEFGYLVGEKIKNFIVKNKLFVGDVYVD